MEQIVLLLHLPNQATVTIEAPTQMTAGELAQGLVKAYALQGVDAYCLRAENPHAFLTGNIPLMDYGLRNGTNLYFYPKKEGPLPSLPPSYTKNNRFDRCVQLDQGLMTVGTDADCAIRLLHVPAIGAVFELQNTARGYVLVPEANTPLYVNGAVLAQDARPILENGDFIHWENLAFLFMHQTLLCAGDASEINGLPYADASEQTGHLIYPQVCRTSRAHDLPPTEDIEILDPPAVMDPQKRNIFVSILPSILMAALIVLLRGSMSGGSMILFSVCSMATGIIGTVITYFETTKRYKKEKQRREETYRAYIEECKTKIEEAREKERRILRSIYITPQQEIRNVMDFSGSLFDRVPSDNDFLDLRLGYGCLPSGQAVRTKRHEVFEKTDALYQLPHEIKRKTRFSNQLPAWIRTREANAIGLHGDFSSLGRMLNQTVLDFASRHYPADLQMYFLLNQQFDEHMQAIALLPHVYDAKAERRNIGHDEESVDRLLKKLYAELSNRESNAAYAQAAPWMILFVYADDTLMRHPIMQFIETASKLHCVYIILSGFQEKLPLGCKYIVRLFSNEKSGLLINMYNREQDRYFLYDYDLLNCSQLAMIAQRLAPVYEGEKSLSNALPRTCTFFEMLRTSAVDSSWVLDHWKRADVSQSLSVPLGITDAHTVIHLDLHEKAHGPHGLVAGTTGSGKSELLISYILSLACHYSPNDVSFLIIDFKGGGMAVQLERLPHLIGTITNISKHDIDRSLVSIRAESLRRQRIFAATKKEDGTAVKNINEYAQLFYQGAVKQPLPHLFIIADEFAELKTQQPKFMDELISTARIGRSLGIHLILATQKPFGVVNDQIWSNSDFKLCMRVQTKEDSNEVLHSPLASEIREPGRGYLQIQRSNVFSLFQSGYSGAPVRTAVEDVPVYRLYALSVSGQRQIIYQTPVIRQEEQQQTQFIAAVSAVCEAYAAGGYPTPSRLCLPPLPAELPFAEDDSDDLYSLAYGVYDHPADQSMGRAVFQLTEGNLLICGDAQTGKTNLLQTLIRTAAVRGMTEYLNIYILDFNTGALKAMDEMDIVGGVILPDQSEKLRNLLKMLCQEIGQRKAAMLEYRVTSVQAYREVSGKPMPIMLVMLDNIASFSDIYEEEFGDVLTYLLREGVSYGIVFAITTTKVSLVHFRRACYLTQRVALYMQDKNEYTVVLDGCRKELPEIRGRILYRHGKDVLEAQVYHAFPAETESERVHAFLELIQLNARSCVKAKRIPEVPAIVSLQAMQAQFGFSSVPRYYVYGIGYDEVEPVAIDLYRQFSLAIAGKNKEGMQQLLGNLLDHIHAFFRDGGAGVFLVDNYERSLEPFSERPEVAEYTTNVQRAVTLLGEAHREAMRRYEEICKRGVTALEDFKLLVFVFHSMDVIKALSVKRDSGDAYRDMAEQYRQVKILFLFTGLDNKNCNGSSLSLPYMLRQIREERQAILFDALSSEKVFSVDNATARDHRGITLGKDDAYRIDDEAVMRVKTVWTEEKGAS